MKETVNEQMTGAAQAALPGFEWSSETPSLPEDRALLAVGVKDMSVFISIEDSLERPATEQTERNNPQAAADGYIEAAEAYRQEGFFIKAASLKGKAAGIYYKTDNILAQMELLDAIDLDRMANNLAKLAEEEQNHDPEMPLRANYPNLFFSLTYKRGEADRHHYSNNYVIFRMMNAHYSLLLNLDSSSSENAYNFARGDLLGVNRDLARDYTYWRRAGLFDWEHADNKKIMGIYS